MKKILKKSIAVFALFFCIITLSYSQSATSIENDYIVVRVFEGASFSSPSIIMITDGETIIKTVQLSVIISKNLDSNLLKIATVLNEVKNDGYHLVTSSSSGNATYFITDYIFEKVAEKPLQKE